MWQVISASRPGTSHLRVDMPCQDAHAYRLRGDTVLAAVADGLGSAAHAEVGAKAAVESALDFLEATLESQPPTEAAGWEKALSQVFTEARQRLEEIAQENELPLREYGTTLIVAVATADWLALGHLGDGAAVAFLEDGRLETVSEPQRGEYANEVKPLTAPDALTHIQFSVKRSPVKGVALLTDGLQALAIHLATGEPHAPFFKPFFAAIGQPIDAQETSQQLADFLDSERVCARTDDDKTLLIIGRILPDESD
jgi:hypothetical protein